MRKALRIAADAILAQGRRLTDEERKRIERTLRLFGTKKGGR